jgi:hypothetical protein
MTCCLDLTPRLTTSTSSVSRAKEALSFNATTALQWHLGDHLHPSES